MDRLEKALSIVRTRTSAGIVTSKVSEGIKFQFFFEFFEVEFLKNPKDYSTYTQFARAVLNELERRVIRKFVDNGNFVNEQGDFVPGNFAEKERLCSTCDNVGWETMGNVAACNCCNDGEFYAPIMKKHGSVRPEVVYTDGLRKAVAQLVSLGKDFLIQQVSACSRLNQYRYSKARNELEDLFYNEIAATENVISFFTGREISFQWTRGANGEFNGGFELYEIMNDVPCINLAYGVVTTTYNKYNEKRGMHGKIDWSKGIERGDIVKIYELIYDKHANPCYVGGYLVPEFESRKNDAQERMEAKA